MKHAIIGTALIIYALMLTPAFIEPSDAIVSTAWIAVALATGIPMFIITLWLISGYIAFIVGIGLLGHSIFRRLPLITSSIKNPASLVFLFTLITLVICLWFYYAT